MGGGGNRATARPKESLCIPKAHYSHFTPPSQGCPAFFLFFLRFLFFCYIHLKMDPYEYTQTVHDPTEHEVDDDDLKKLEKDLAPSSADFYGILNISKKVVFFLPA